jgi:hypothetical protein
VLGDDGWVEEEERLRRGESTFYAGGTRQGQTALDA